METKKGVILSGGLLLLLISEVKLDRLPKADYLANEQDPQSNRTVLRDLIYVFTKRQYSFSNSDCSKFLSGDSDGGRNIPFNSTSAAGTFDDLVKSNYPVALGRMKDFLDKHIDRDREIWLIRALIEAVELDVAEDTPLFIMENGSPVKKGALDTISGFCVDSLVLGVLHYVLVHRNGMNKLGGTYIKSNSKTTGEGRKYNGDLGKGLDRQISPRSLDQKYIVQEAVCESVTEPEIEYDSEEEPIDEIIEDIISNDKPHVILTGKSDVAPDLYYLQNGTFYSNIDPDNLYGEESDELGPFDEYLQKAVEYYSNKKTLLYENNPRPFYDIYVPNSLKYHRFHINGLPDVKYEIEIENPSVPRLEAESKYVIIEGTGGIGKSMLLNHFLLSSASEYPSTGKIPVLITLRDYKESTPSLVDFIWKSISAYDPGITQRLVVEALENKNVILLLDGFDEISSSVRDAFSSDFEAFMKSYTGNTVIMTSRPIDAFISFAKLSVFDLQPLSKEQALALVNKLEFWDPSAQKRFAETLNKSLYETHTQFASNPLLLTIMLMTYSSFGEIPAKMHVFYSKAYETMARLHDATKNSFQRPLNTGLTPEEFAKLFSEFCARTYLKEELEFTFESFSLHMSKVLKNHEGITVRDFISDLTDHLCIMYQEGNQYYFIHRSFQEYFAAFYFASEYDDKLRRIGEFFEKKKHRAYMDRTFEMMYDMSTKKIERFIFYPFLHDLLEDCYSHGPEEAYWSFLEKQYPVIYCEDGETGNFYITDAESFLYRTIVKEKNLYSDRLLIGLDWPDEIHDLPCREWIPVYTSFIENNDLYEKYPDLESVDEQLLKDTMLIPEDELPEEYEEFFGHPNAVGSTTEIEIYELRKNAYRHNALCSFLSDNTFPIKEEFLNVIKYYEKLEEVVKREEASEDIFDD